MISSSTICFNVSYSNMAPKSRRKDFNKRICLVPIDTFDSPEIVQTFERSSVSIPDFLRWSTVASSATVVAVQNVFKEKAEKFREKRLCLHSRRL